MSLIYALIGAVAGGLLAHFPGAVFGAGAGWLSGSFVELQERTASLEKEVSWLRKHIAAQAKLSWVEPKKDPSPETLAAVSHQADTAARVESCRPVTTDPGKEASPAYSSNVAPTQPSRQEFEKAQFKDEPSSIMDAITGFFTGGNLLVKSGVIILFFGVSFLVKYAAENGHFPVELRLAATAIGGITLIAAGWRLREKRSEYALSLQGGGIGILFLTTYAAFRLFHLLPASTSFALLVAISTLCGALAVMQNSRTLALFGISGGFIAPILASIGSGNPASLFGYYAILNTGIIVIAWFRAWRLLNLAGFAYTFLIGAIWGSQFYRPEHFAMVEPFLILFFLMYVGVSVLFALRQPPELKGLVDGTLVFGTPITAFAMQAGLVQNVSYGLAWSALSAGLAYLTLFLLLHSKDQCMRPLADAFLAFGTIFVTLAIPLAFDGRWTSAAWAMEGAALIWIGFRQHKRLARVLGILLQFAGGIAFVADLPFSANQIPVMNGLYLGCILISLAALYSAWTIWRFKKWAEEWERPLGYMLAGWGFIWWFVSGLHELDAHMATGLVYGASLVFVTASCLTSHFLQRRLDWPELSWPPLLLLPAMVCFLLPQIPYHPLAHGGWFAWPAAFTVNWWILHQREDEVPTLYSCLLHGGSIWFFSFLATYELGWQIHFFFGSFGSWLTISRGLVVVAMLLAIACAEKPTWPLRKHQELYMGIVALPLATAVLCWVVVASLITSGDAWPFPWLPVFNPLDLAIAGALSALVIWVKRLLQISALHDLVIENRQLVLMVGTAVSFLWLNSMLARSLHHLGGITFTAEALFRSSLAQTSFAIFWSLLALCAMVVATRRGLRTLWLGGAGLLGVVVVKLFLIDLAGHGTIGRIISFVAVGLLLLAIGWFSPAPPRAVADDGL